MAQPFSVKPLGYVMASGRAQHVYLTDQLANSLQGAGSPHSQSLPLSSSYCWPSDCLGGQQAGHVFFFFFFKLPSSGWLALASSHFQPKQLPEVGEGDGELGRSTLKAALPSSSWLMSVASLED